MGLLLAIMILVVMGGLFKQTVLKLFNLLEAKPADPFKNGKTSKATVIKIDHRYDKARA